MERLNGGEKGQLEVEKEHFDDFETADLAVRGMKLVQEWKDYRAREEAEKQRRIEEARAKAEREEAENNIVMMEFLPPRWVNRKEGSEGDEERSGLREEERARESQFELLTIPQELLEEYNLPKGLPEEICVMGGTARSLARRMIAGDLEPVRDLDLVCIEDLGAPEAGIDEGYLDAISAKYMKDDYTYGHGIQTDTLKNYFQTRDFTMNQCLITGDKLLMTRAAYNDLQENIVRPSFYEQKGVDDYCGGRLFLKALLIKTRLDMTTASCPTLEDFAVYTYNDDKIDEKKFQTEDAETDDAKVVWSSEWYDTERGNYELMRRGLSRHWGARIRRPSVFDQALTLNKAMSADVATAVHFTEVLAEWGIIDAEYERRPMTLAKSYNEYLRHPFKFRPLTKNEERVTNENFENLDELHPGLTNYQTQDSAMRQALNDYESIAVDYNNGDEVRSGQYTDRDYAWMNTVSRTDDSEDEDEDDEDGEDEDWGDDEEDWDDEDDEDWEDGE